MKQFFKVLLLGVIIVQTGCEALRPPRPGAEAQFAPTYPVGPDPKRLDRANDGGVYNAETALPLFETPRARHVGDIVTVVLIEKTNATKNQTTMQMKNDTTQVTNSVFMGRPIQLGSGYDMDFNLNAQRQFQGQAQAVQNNTLVGNISVTVSKVLSNGNMMVTGEKWVRINQGKEFVQLSGIIRPQDLRPDNTIYSDKVADARISYGATGQVNNTNSQGWFSRFIWGPLFPE